MTTRSSYGAPRAPHRQLLLAAARLQLGLDGQELARTRHWPREWTSDGPCPRAGPSGCCPWYPPPEGRPSGRPGPRRAVGRRAQGLLAALLRTGRMLESRREATAASRRRLLSPWCSRAPPGPHALRAHGAEAHGRHQLLVRPSELEQALTDAERFTSWSPTDFPCATRLLQEGALPRTPRRCLARDLSCTGGWQMVHPGRSRHGALPGVSATHRHREARTGPRPRCPAGTSSTWRCTPPSTRCSTSTWWVDPTSPT